MRINTPPSPRATLVLAHGAGAGMDSPFMNEFAQALMARGLEVVRFEFPYMAKLRSDGKRRAPDRMPALEAAYQALLETLNTRARLFIGGKSMGGRVATRIADVAQVRGVIALGYPFHPPKQPSALRVEHLTTLKTPCLIVQGTRDPFGNEAEVATYPLATGIKLHWLPDGDHSFVPRKRSGRSAAQNMEEAVSATEAFIDAH